MNPQRNKAQRAAAAVAAVTGTLLLMTSTAGSQTGSSSAFPNGTASASAQSVKVNPTAASLSIGATIGISLAGYQNDVAKAEARGVDLGVIGTTLAGEGCDGGDPTLPADQQPQPLVADSREPDAAGGMSAPEAIAGITIPAIQKLARATPEPMGEATTLSAPVGQAGVAEIAGARSNALVTVIEHRTRRAVATSEIAEVSLGGGVVKLGGLKWQAVQQTGADETDSAAFTIGSVVIGGVPVPIPSGDLSPLFATVNQALAPLGIELRAPALRNDGGVVAVDALTVAIIPSATRDALSGQLLGTLQPVREALVDALLELDCGNATYITVADVALGSVTGSGSLSLELGGVIATSRELQFTSLLQPPGGPALTPGTPDELIAGQPPSLSGSVEAPSGGAGVAGARSRKDPRSQVAAPVAAIGGGTRGGKLAVLAGGVLLLLAVLAELDRRKMLAAMRTATITEA
jgi:hypothetical protein